MYQCSKSKSNICQHTYIVNIPLSRDRAKCAGPLLDSFSCDFTEHNIGGFVNQPIDDPELAAKENRIDWKQYDVKTSSIVGDTSANKLDKTNGKPRDTPLVFPKTDHSNGIDNHGRYMSLNGSFYGDVNNAGYSEQSHALALLKNDGCVPDIHLKAHANLGKVQPETQSLLRSA